MSGSDRIWEISILLLLMWASASRVEYHYFPAASHWFMIYDFDSMSEDSKNVAGSSG